jgi:hypothetical protein
MPANDPARVAAEEMARLQMIRPSDVLDAREIITRHYAERDREIAEIMRQCTLPVRSDWDAMSPEEKRLADALAVESELLAHINRAIALLGGTQ